MTSDRPGEWLRSLLEAGGVDPINDPGSLDKLPELLAKNCAFTDAQRHALGLALDAGIPRMIAALGGRATESREQIRLIETIAPLIGQELASWTIAAWAGALDRGGATKSGGLSVPAVHLKAISELPISRGAGAQLEWTTENCDTVELLPLPGRVNAHGDCWVSPDFTTEYVLRGQRAGHIAEQRIAVEVKTSILRRGPKQPGSHYKKSAGRRNNLLAKVFLALLVLSSILWFAWRTLSQNRATAEAILTADPPHLRRPGTTVISWTGPTPGRIEPHTKCVDRSQYWVCTIDRTTRFTLSISDGKRGVVEASVEVTVDGSGR